MVVGVGYGDRVRAFVHRHFLPLLVGSYLLAAAWPSPGEAVRRAAVDTGLGVTCPVPLLLLSVLLFNAGVAADAAGLAGVVRRPRAVLAGLATSVIVPVAVLAVLAAGLSGWHDAGERQALLIGLGVVAAMPIAGSSAAWSQNAGGDAALSLGLVVASTALSPLTTPLALAAVGPLAGGDAMGGLAGPGTAVALLAGVAVPSLAGMAVGRAAGRDRAAGWAATLKLVNAAVLLTLCYANATSALPAVAAEPDWDYLALTVAAAAAMCGAGFAAGWAVARAVRAADRPARSLVFGMGMSNNGTGLVLAGAALAGRPEAALPVLAYNLVQHLVAGAVGRRFRPHGPGATGEGRSV